MTLLSANKCLDAGVYVEVIGIVSNNLMSEFCHKANVSF
ncbi:hypothetical protein MIDIC_20047 [Alphaproteobacteria bacterium]